MRDGERIKLGMAQDARREAGRAARAIAGIVQAVAAERGHHGMSRSQAASERGAGALDFGWIDSLVRANASSSSSSLGEMVEHAREEARFACGLADLLRPDAAYGKKAAELLRLGGKIRQRRDGKRLGRLAPGAAIFVAESAAAVHGRSPRWPKP